MRMTASWSGSKRSYRIQVCGTKMRPMASSPRIINRGTVQTPKLCKEPRRSPSSLRVLRPQALRNTSAARPASCQALLPFRSLDPFRALRQPDRRQRDEERLSPLRTKNRQQAKNDCLTGKAPYGFESGFLQRRVSDEPGRGASPSKPDFGKLGGRIEVRLGK